MTKKTILIADARKRISMADSVTLSRHIEYIKEFRKITPDLDTELCVIQPTLYRKEKAQFFENLLISQWNCFDFLLQKKRRQQLQESVMLIVAGDPWESYLLSKVIKWKVGQKKIPIQVQIHAELSPQWANLNFRNVLRIKLAKYGLKNSNNVRVVSEEQRKFIAKKFLISYQKLSTVPVRLGITENFKASYSVSRPNSIGLVGRIHTERNVEKFIQIAKYFLMQNPSMKILIAGDSTQGNRLQQELATISSSQVHFLGKLSPNELVKAWEKIGVLVSTAKSESFGRAIREALVHGVPVLAHDSFGARELFNACPEGVSLFDDQDSEAEIFQKYVKLKSIKLGVKFSEFQRKLDLEVAPKMAKVWLKVIEDFPIR